MFLPFFLFCVSFRSSLLTVLFLFRIYCFVLFSCVVSRGLRSIALSRSLSQRTLTWPIYFPFASSLLPLCYFARSVSFLLVRLFVRCCDQVRLYLCHFIVFVALCVCVSAPSRVESRRVEASRGAICALSLACNSDLCALILLLNLCQALSFSFLILLFKLIVSLIHFVCFALSFIRFCSLRSCALRLVASRRTRNRCFVFYFALSNIYFRVAASYFDSAANRLCFPLTRKSLSPSSFCCFVKLCRHSELCASLPRFAN